MKRALLAVVLALSACGPGTEVEDKHQPFIQMTPKLAAGWNELKPGGDTVCARGTPYSFFVAPGKTNKVVIDFMGGGACWTQESCSFAGALFDDSVDALRDRVKKGFPGVYDRDRADNPFADYFHVVVPYCTGDIHWGNNVVTYGTGSDAVTIRHKGAVNAKAVLDWVYANFPRPEQIMVTGCSAGAYGSIYWAPHVKQHYGDVKVQQLGDSGAGVITDSFFKDSFPQWKALDNAPSFIPTLDPATNDWYAMTLADLYGRVGNFFPDMPLAQFNTDFDGTQSFFFKAMGGGDEKEWSKRMNASVGRIHELTPNFFSYTGGGPQHCILPKNDFGAFSADGVKFLDWLNGYLKDGTAANVTCKGDECSKQPEGAVDD